jgi:MYXO-CTERM domain-containing protein
MRLTAIIIPTLALLLTAPPALACDVEARCALVELTGEVPCVELTLVERGCYIEAALTCTPDQAPSLSLNGEPAVIPAPERPRQLYIGYSDPDRQPSTLSWTRADQSGAVSIRTVDKPYEDDPCGDDTSCAATPPQRPTSPIIALLPLILGALVWRRRST